MGLTGATDTTEKIMDKFKKTECYWKPDGSKSNLIKSMKIDEGIQVRLLRDTTSTNSIKIDADIKTVVDSKLIDSNDKDDNVLESLIAKNIRNAVGPYRGEVIIDRID